LKEMSGGLRLLQRREMAEDYSKESKWSEEFLSALRKSEWKCLWEHLR